MSGAERAIGAIELKLGDARICDQMDGVSEGRPDIDTHPEFSTVLEEGGVYEYTGIYSLDA